MLTWCIPVIDLKLIKDECQRKHIVRVDREKCE